jgi:membrane protein DedA with SNARE-associated domain
VPLASVSDTLTTFIGDHGLYAVFALMLIDSVLPAASELVMLYAGVLASGALTGQDVVLFGHQIDSHFWGYVAIAAAGVAGQTVGSIIGWAIGLYGGRPLVERHGRWLHLGPENLDRAERWFDRWGDWAVFLGRMTPVVRSFVSIPAGIFEMPLAPYTLFTLIGSALWAFAFAAIGYAVGSNYERFHHFFDIALVAGAALLVLYLVARRVSRLKRAT